MGIFSTLAATNPSKNVVFGGVASAVTISTNTSNSTLATAVITLTGTKPVLITLRPYLPDVIGLNISNIGYTCNTAANMTVSLNVLCSGSSSNFLITMAENFGTTAPRHQRWPPEAFWWLDTNPVAGTVTYTLQASAFNCTFNANGVQLVVEEVN